MTLLWAVILFGILIFFHELGHFIFAKLVGVKVLKFSLGFGPKLVSKKVGETEYIISALPLGGYVKPLGEEPGEELDEEDKPRAFNYQPVWKRALIILAGPVFNLILAYIIFVIFLSVKLPVVIPDLSSMTTTIENVMEESPAMRAGIKKDDTIVSINGRRVTDWSEMSKVFSKNPGNEVSLGVKRGNNLINFTLIPEPVTIKDKEGEETTIGRIGVSKKLNVNVIESKGVLQAPLKGLEAVYYWSLLILESVGKLLTGSISAKQLGGPIVIVDAASRAASIGAFAYFNFIAIISINLAILNLFPVPVLDGGHLVFLSIEAVRGKSLSDKVMTVATKIGFAMLILLIAFVFYNDTVRIIVPWVQKTINP